MNNNTADTKYALMTNDELATALADLNYPGVVTLPHERARRVYLDRFANGRYTRETVIQYLLDQRNLAAFSH